MNFLLIISQINWPLVIVGVCFVVTFLLKIPIAYGMIASVALYLLASGQDLAIFSSSILDTFYSQYVVFAVPLFIFTAQIMNSGKVTETIFKFAGVLVGRLRGGMGHVNIIASLIFSGMTGSAIADASGLGLMEIETMRREGYDDDFSCALTAASATIGPVFPPSIPFLIYAMLSGTSVGALFLGGIVPGVLIAIMLMIYTAYVAKKRNYPRGKTYKFKEFLIFTFKAIPALLTPIILLAGIYGGAMTPTEAGAVAAFYSIIISVFAYKVLTWQAFKKAVFETIKGTGVVSIMIGAAGAFNYVIAVEHIPEMVGNFILGLTDNRYMFYLVINIVFLILGMFLDTSTIQLVFVAMLLPVARSIGIDLVHFGIVVSLNMMIGLSTPPYGCLLFITAGIAKVPLKGVMKEAMPMIYCMILVLIIVTYVPDIVMFLPRLLTP